MSDETRTLIIAIVCIIASAFISGVFVYSRFHVTSAVTPPTTTQLISPAPPTVAPTEISSLSDPNLKEAMQVLDSFNNYLYGAQYAQAAELFDWSMGDLKTIFANDYAAGDNGKTLANVCQHPNFCLRFYKILKTKKMANDEYRFTIQYQTKDGQIFVNSAHVSGTFVNNTDFLYDVKKINGKFKVISPPNFFNIEAE